jgi:hypothetical protein
MIVEEVFGAVRQRSEAPPVPDTVAEPVDDGGVVGVGVGDGLGDVERVV